MFLSLQHIDLAKPKSGASLFFPACLKGTTPSGCEINFFFSDSHLAPKFSKW